MKSFYVTTTENHAESVMSEILRIDGEATISHRQTDKTLMLIRTEKMSEWTLEAIPGVGHAIPLHKLSLRTA